MNTSAISTVDTVKSATMHFPKATHSVYISFKLCQYVSTSHPAHFCLYRWTLSRQTEETELDIDWNILFANKWLQDHSEHGPCSPCTLNCPHKRSHFRCWRHCSLLRKCPQSVYHLRNWSWAQCQQDIKHTDVYQRGVRGLGVGEEKLHYSPSKRKTILAMFMQWFGVWSQAVQSEYNIKLSFRTAYMWHILMDYKKHYKKMFLRIELLSGTLSTQSLHSQFSSQVKSFEMLKTPDFWELQL